MDSRDMIVFKRIMQTLCENQQVLECKIPMMGDPRTISVLRALTLSVPELSCFRVFASYDDDNVCVIRIVNAGSTTFSTRAEGTLRLTRQLVPARNSSARGVRQEKPSKAIRHILEGGLLDIMMRMQSSPNMSYIPNADAHHHDRTRNFPISLCRRDISAWLRSDSAVLIMYGSLGCGKVDEIVHYILQDCRRRAEKCRAIYVIPEKVQLLAMLARICRDREEMAGNTIGYKLDNSSRISDHTNVALCTDETMLLSFCSNASQHMFAELTHLIVGSVGRRLVETDLLLSVLKEKQRFHPLLKLILLTESKDVDDLARFFKRSRKIMIPEMYAQEPSSHIRLPFGVEHVFLDGVLGHVCMHAEILETKRNMENDHPMKVLADMQERYGGTNYCCYLAPYLDAQLERCFYARYSCELADLLKLFQRHKHLVDYQHREIKLTLLMIAAGKGFSDVVEALLKIGANPLQRGKKDLTALDWCERGVNNSCWQQMDDCCRRHIGTEALATIAGPMLCQVYHRIYDPYTVDHSLVVDTVLYIIAKRSSGKILVTLPDVPDVLRCYELLRQCPPAKANRLSFMVCHRYITEEELREATSFPPFVHFLVILMAGPLFDMLPSLDSIDFVVDTGLRVEQVYNPTKGAFLRRVSYNTKQSSAFLRLLAKQGCFFMYTRQQLDSMVADVAPNRNSAGLPMQILQALLSRSRSGPSVEKFFDDARTAAACSNVNRSFELLEQIGAIEQPLRIATDLGVLLAHLRIELHLGKALLYSMFFRCLDPILTIVAALRVGNPFKDPANADSMGQITQLKQTISHRSYSDCLVLLRLYQKWGPCKMLQNGDEMVAKYRLKVGVMDAVANVRTDLMGILRSLNLVTCGVVHNIDDLNKHSDNWTRVKACLAAGFYPNLAKVDYGTRSLKDYNGTASPLQLHPLSVVSLDELPTKWVVYEHKEDFLLHLQDTNDEGSPVHIVENTAVSDCMVLLLCGIDRIVSTSTRTAAEAPLTDDRYVPESAPQQTEQLRELLVGNKYAFQLPSDSYDAVVRLRWKLAHLFREFTAHPAAVLQDANATRIIEHVFKILEEEEKSVCSTTFGGIGVRPKIKNRYPMGVRWNTQINATPHRIM